MAIITAEIKLPEVAQTVMVRLYFPTDLPKSVGCEVKGAITLLHGLSNTGADWMQMSAACRYAADNGYILIAPDAGNGFYHNMAYGPPWYTILTEYLPAHLNCIFNIPTAREMNFIAGLSMGGYGAMRLGLSQPGKYAAVGSFSGALDLAAVASVCFGDVPLKSVLVPVLGETLTVPPEADLFHLARQAAQWPEKQRPRLLTTCGLQDENTLVGTRAFARVVKDLPLEHTALEWDGVHEWNFWDRSLTEFISFIQNGSTYAERKREDWCSPAQTGGPI